MLVMKEKKENQKAGGSRDIKYKIRRCVDNKVTYPSLGAEERRKRKNRADGVSRTNFFSRV